MSHDTDHNASPTPALEVLRASLSTPRERERFDELLALLETPAPDTQDRASRIESTASVISAARDADSAARVGHRSPLAPQEAARVDAWVEGTSDDAIEGLLSRLEIPADASRASRIDATLALVQQDMDSQSDRLRLDAPSEAATATSRRLRLSDFGAIAAALLLIAAIGVPALTNIRANTWGAQSTANLQQAGFATQLFAQDHDAKIPHTTRRAQSTGAPQWWNVGDPNQSHSAHLFALIEGGYVTFETLNAPGNTQAPGSRDELGQGDWRSFDQLSYSYRLFDKAPRLTELPQSILIADRSPVIRQAIETGTIDPFANSDNHRGEGQHVAYSDASVAFFSTPVLPGGDNLWLPRSAEQTGRLSLRGDERPADATDQFVGP